MRTKKMVFFLLIILSLSLNLTGCMVGPNYHPSNPPMTTHYTETPLPAKTVSTKIKGTNAGTAQYFEACRDIPADWWALYHSREINYLINRGLAHNPNLMSAMATLQQAEETLNAQIGNSLFPAISTQFSAERQRFTGANIGGVQSASIFNVYNASVSASYTLDVFGGARRQIEALHAQVDYQHYQLDAAYLTLTSNIVTTAIAAASAQAQINATNDLINALQKILDLTQQQYQLGGASEANVLSQQAQLQQTKATLPPLIQSLEQANHALAVLVGSLPSQTPIPMIDLDKLSLPMHLPIGVPSLLVKQRPDVQSSEALLHAASAQIGVATANLFPQFTLNALFGWQSANLSNLISPSNKVWSLAGKVLQPVFQGGALLAQRRGAIDAYNQAVAQYQETVLTAFQNVADALRAIQNDAMTLQAQRAAEVAAKNSLILTQQQYKLGGVSFVNLLTAEQQYQLALINRIRAQAARYADTAALFQALGGGWWNYRQPLHVELDNRVAPRGVVYREIRR